LKDVESYAGYKCLLQSDSAIEVELEDVEGQQESVWTKDIAEAGEAVPEVSVPHPPHLLYPAVEETLQIHVLQPTYLDKLDIAEDLS